jgi:hypothetical protein
MTHRISPDSSGSTPQYLADYYYSQVTTISNAFVDYYVSATDAYGNTYKSPIQHVWVGAGSGGGSGSTGNGGPVSLSPTNPVAGKSVTIQYVATGRAIASATNVYLHLGWNNWNPVVSPDAAMTLNSASNWWQATVTIPANATNLNCVFNNGSGTWDNNGGANWNFTVASNSAPQAPAAPANLAAAVSASQINLSWTASAGATGYIISRGGTPVAICSATNYSDTGLSSNTAYCYFVVATNSVGNSAASAIVCTNTLGAAVNLPPFVLDGGFDYPGYLLASNGMVLYGAVRGTTLYVATGSPGTNGPNDHFVFVSDQLLPAATAAAPWAKFGSNAVANTKPYLAGESTDTYVSWFVNSAATNWPCAKSPANSGALEGTLDLVGAFGYLPTNIYLCAAAYVTTNGGPLVAECPAGAGSNLGTNGFLMLPLAALRDSLGNGTFDLCDPARGFKMVTASAQNTNHLWSFAAMPGRSYQVQCAGSLSGTWTNLAGTNYAAPPQMLLNFTDAPAAGTAVRFYRAELLP